MPAKQTAFSFDSSPDHSLDPLPHLRDEIARTWALPLGERVEITFHPAFPLASIVGVLELRAAPDFPWAARHALALRIDGQDFTSRDIQHWRLP